MWKLIKAELRYNWSIILIVLLFQLLTNLLMYSWWFGKNRWIQIYRELFPSLSQTPVVFLALSYQILEFFKFNPLHHHFFPILMAE